MKTNTYNIKSALNYIPLIGISFFVLLWFYASTLYPGGSQASMDSEGFDWVHNYWCNLTSHVAVNGVPNPARGYAIPAMYVLCLSLMLFFYRFAEVFVRDRFWRIAIKSNAILSMGFAMYIFSDYHDLMTSLSSIFGLVVLVGLVLTIFRLGLRRYKLICLLCILLLGANNYIYYTGHYLIALPLLQKISFVTVLLTIIGLNIKMIDADLQAG